MTAKRQRKTVIYLGKRCRIIDNCQPTQIKFEYEGAGIWRDRSAITGGSR